VTLSDTKIRLPVLFTVTLLVIMVLPCFAAAEPLIEPLSLPGTADASEPIPVFVNVSSQDYVYEVILSYRRPGDALPSYEYLYLTSGDNANGTWTGAIPEQIWEGSLNCHVIAKDNTGQSRYPAQGSITIQLEGEPPSTFPWHIVIMVVGLIIVFVLTELAFKPGLYRKTGRERAEILEEEDRLRAEEEANPQSPKQPLQDSQN